MGDVWEYDNILACGYLAGDAVDRNDQTTAAADYQLRCAMHVGIKVKMSGHILYDNIVQQLGPGGGVQKFLDCHSGSNPPFRKGLSLHCYYISAKKLLQYAQQL